MLSPLPKTKIRREIFINHLKKLDAPVSANDLHLIMRNEGKKISISTVYRYLYLLAKDGHIEMITLDKRSFLFSSKKGENQ